MTRGLGALAAAGFILAGLAPAAAKDGCKLTQLASLEMGDSPGRVVITAQIGDAPHHLMIDTGGVFSELYDDVVKQLGLPTQRINSRVEIYDVGGNIAQNFVRVPKLMVGSVYGDNWRMVVKPRGPGQDPGIDGILGPDVISRFDIEFDFAGRKVNFISPDHCPGAVVYWAKSYADADFTMEGGHVVIPMILDGQDVKATIDTGAPRTGISESLSHRLFGIDSKSPGIERDPNAPPGSPYAFRHRFGSLSVGGLAVKNPLIYLLPDLAEQSFRRRHTGKADLDPLTARPLHQVQLLLGMNVLTKLHLYIAYRESKLYLTAADAH